MRNHLPLHPSVRMMLLLNTLQQPSRTLMPHLVKIPLLMLLLNGLVFFFLQNFFPPDSHLAFFVQRLLTGHQSLFFYIKKSSSLSQVACVGVSGPVFNWYNQVESSLHRYFQVRIASANPHRVDSPPFVSLLYSSSLAFINFPFVFLWVQRCNLHYLFVFFCFSSFPFCVYRHCSLSSSFW